MSLDSASGVPTFKFAAITIDDAEGTRYTYKIVLSVKRNKFERSSAEMILVTNYGNGPLVKK
jgi:hypothetical protein